MAGLPGRRGLIALVILVALGAGGTVLVRRALRPPPRAHDRPTESTVAAAETAPVAPAAPTSLGPDDWPRFRGPNGQATHAAATFPTEWSDTKGVAWKTELPGPGSSSPIVVGDRVFVTCYSGYGVRKGPSRDPLLRHLVCLKRDTGKIDWTATIDNSTPETPAKGYLTEHGYASSTPCSDGESIYVFFGKSGVYAYDLAGKERWRTSVGDRTNFKGWGSAASPIVHDDFVIVNAASESRAIIALERKTGKEAWRAEAQSTELSFNTPVLVSLPDGRIDLALSVPGEVWGLNPATGKLRWHATIRATGNVSPSVAAADGAVFATGGYDTSGTTAVRAGGSGDVSASNTVWSKPESSYVPSPLVHDGRVHWVDDAGRAACLDAATGKVLYRESLPLRSRSGGKAVYASLVRAGDRLIAVTRSSGVFVLAVGPELKVLAHNELTDDSDFNASPAISTDRLFLRSNRAIYCIAK